ncbi:MAG: hypothetical protein M0D55_04485 [Elusimicrobiota bacterium]|nr:MAG: hypothetical protein M0D55_04485 [Elusimicrobiota bacterium]
MMSFSATTASFLSFMVPPFCGVVVQCACVERLSFDFPASMPSAVLWQMADGLDHLDVVQRDDGELLELHGASVCGLIRSTGSSSAGTLM